MMIENIASDIYSDPLIATIYHDARFLENRMLIRKIFSYPKREITGVNIFINREGMVIGGQLSVYSPEKGIRCYLLDKELQICKR